MTTKGDAVDPEQAGKPDLDVWRSEAGEAARLTVHIPKAPWRYGFSDGAFAFRDVVGDAKGRGFVRGESSAEWPAIGAFIAAARTGWPRDAARVAALCERVAALEAHVATLDAMKAIGDWQEALAARCEVLEAALSEALDEFEDAIQYKLEYLVTKHGDRATIARLRAIAAGTAAATGEEPAR